MKKKFARTIPGKSRPFLFAKVVIIVPGDPWIVHWRIVHFIYLSAQRSWRNCNPLKLIAEKRDIFFNPQQAEVANP
jgi:hypothetical protein